MIYRKIERPGRWANICVEVDERTKAGYIIAGDDKIGISGPGDLEKFIIALGRAIDDGKDTDFYRDDGNFASVYRESGYLVLKGVSASVGLTDNDATTLRNILRNLRGL